MTKAQNNLNPSYKHTKCMTAILTYIVRITSTLCTDCSHTIVSTFSECYLFLLQGMSNHFMSIVQCILTYMNPFGQNQISVKADK